MLEIRVLGPLRVDLDGHQIATGRGRRVPELLGWLALHPGLHPRWQIAGCFWPDVPDVTARNNLRQITWDLRRALADAAGRLQGDREHLGLVSGPGLWVDAAEFERQAAAGRYAEAVALVTGNVLDGLDSAWIDEERTRRRRELAEVLGRLADLHAEHGDVAAAVATTRRILELEPYDEAALRLLVERLDAGGRRGEAVLAADAFKARLRTDLGVEPSAATARVVARLRQPAAPAAPRPPRPARAVLPVASRGFVARHAELAALHALLEHARSDGQVIVGIEGDAGIGKTALAAEFAARAESGGVLVLAGRSTQDELVPYQPWVEALRNHLAGRDAAGLRTELPADHRPLLPLLPELADLLGEAPAGPATPPDRFRMLQAVVAWLDTLADRGPVLLVLDDLHLADAASLQLLRHLAASPAGGPLLVLFTCRPRVRTTSSAYVTTLAECSRTRLSWLRLRGLTEDELGVVVSATTDTPPSGAFTRALHHRTGGNPFFATEIVRSLVDTGALRVRDGACEYLGGDELPVPQGVRNVLAGRLARLPEGSRGALEIGSAVGMEFDRAVVGAVLGQSGDALLDPLDAAVASGLLLEPGPPGRYAFAHPLVRDVLYMGLTSNRRAWLHERIAGSLESSGAPSIAVSRHLLDAGTTAAIRRAATHALDAAAGALEQGAWEDARSLVERVLACGDVVGELRTRLLSLRGLTFAAEWQLMAEGRAVVYSRVASPPPPELSQKEGGAGVPTGGTSAGATSPAIS